MLETTPSEAPKIRDGGLLAEFRNPTALVRACEKIRDAGYQKWDAHSPFPVHGIDPAMGIRRTRLPWVIFLAAITGTVTALALQYYTNAFEYPFIISGKPLFSLPANIPVAFELTVLFAGVTTFLLTLAINGLPRLHHPLFNSEKFKRVTDDGFFIAISSADPRYTPAATRALLEEAGAKHVEQIEDDSHIGHALPRHLKVALTLAFVLGLIPLGFIARARVKTSPETRIHVVPDMDFQEKYKAQTANTLFMDGRAARLPVEGTVAVGALKLDEHLNLGIVDGAWATVLPKEVPMELTTIERGHERYDIYCAPCHGIAGYGDGMVARRAQAIGAQKWVPPTSLHEERIQQQPIGQMFNTITHGIRNMPPYGHAIPTQDRWAIAAYISALQLSQLAKVEDIPPELRLSLK